MAHPLVSISTTDQQLCPPQIIKAIGFPYDLLLSLHGIQPNSIIQELVFHSKNGLFQSVSRWCSRLSPALRLICAFPL